MEVLDSDLKDRVLAEMGAYDYTRYTAADVKAALEHTTCSLEDFKALLSPAAAPFLEEMARKAHGETQRHFGNTVYLFTPLYIANYCENYCVYCGFNCYNHIQRMKLTMEQIQHEMEIIAQSGMEEILILTGRAGPRATWLHRRGLQAGPEVLPHGGAGDLPGEHRGVPLPPPVRGGLRHRLPGDLRHGQVRAAPPPRPQTGVALPLRCPGAGPAGWDAGGGLLRPLRPL